MAVVRVKAVLAVFAVAIVVCKAGPTESKDPTRTTVHVYAVPTFSVKPTSPGEHPHYIVKEGSNVTLTCETSFASKNILIDWVHPNVKNEYEEKQIHSRHDGMNIKERILHIKNAQAEDSGSYTCHTRSLHQTTWGSPNTFYIQVGEEKKVHNVGILRFSAKSADTPAARTNTLSLKKYPTTPTTTTTTASATTTAKPTSTPTSSPTTTSTRRPTTRVITTITTTTTTTTAVPPAPTTTSAPTNTTQGPPPAPSQFDVASFLGGMALVVGILLLSKLIHYSIKKYRQRSYGYQNM